MEAAIGVNQRDWCPKIQKLGPGMGLQRRGERAREAEKKVGGREKALGDAWAVEWEGRRQETGRLGNGGR